VLSGERSCRLGGESKTDEVSGWWQ
jgi:hypothetical protein